MKRRIRSAAVVVTACLTGSLTATPSLATSDGFARTIKVVPQPLEVKSNGHSYTGVNALGNIVAFDRDQGR